MRKRILSLVAAFSIMALGTSVNAVNAASVLQDPITHVNFGTQTVEFRILYDGTPDFFTVDAFERQADAFQFYIGATDISLPTRPASIIRGGEIHYGAGIPIRDVSGPPDGSPGQNGWGPMRGIVPYSLSSDNVLSFVVSFDVLDVTGQFPFIFGTYHYGRTDQQFNGVPLPAALPLFAGGLAGLGLLGWWRRRKRSEAT